MSEDGLSFEGFTIDEWLDEFEESTALTRREAKKILYQGAKDILKASQTMCPVDEGNLEEAHELQQVRLNEDQSVIEIRVGGVVNGRDVDEYAMIVHEYLLPFGAGINPKTGQGPWSIGPKSRDKDASNPAGMRVGGKFLERAVDMYEDKIVEAVAAVLPEKK